MRIYSQKSAWTVANDKPRCSDMRGRTYIVISVAVTAFIMVTVGVGLGIYSILREKGDYMCAFFHQSIKQVSAHVVFCFCFVFFWFSFATCNFTFLHRA